jgi:two-component system sensor histidine kinase TctE
VIQDNGPGIPLKERQRVFERFYRVLGTRVNGTGLGLAIVREIAKSHNATVELLDPPGTKGTLVRITFPNVQTEKQAC